MTNTQCPQSTLDGLTIVNRSTQKKRTPTIQITNLKLLFRVTKSSTGLSLLFLLLRETCMEWTQAWAITAGTPHDNLEHTDILRLTSRPYLTKTRFKMRKRVLMVISVHHLDLKTFLKKTKHWLHQFSSTHTLHSLKCVGTSPGASST